MILHVRVKAGSKFNRIEKDAEANWIVRIKAQPVDGKANIELIRFLSEKLEISKSSLEIISGHSSKFKKISIDGVNEHEAEIKFSKK